MDNSPRSGWLRRLDLGLVLGFLVVLTLPATLMIGWPENRSVSPQGERLATWPLPLTDHPSWKELAGRFKDFVRDRFGLRSSLVTWNAALQFRFLGISTSPQVLAGPDGWLHFTGERSIDYHRANLPFATGELESYVKSFADWHRFLQERGIPLLVVITPNKSTVYPETLPAWVTRVGRETRADTLVRALASQGIGEVVDLRPVLQAARKDGRLLYSRTESHWNDLGAYVGFRAICERLAPVFPKVRIPTLDEIKATPVSNESGDLGRLLGVEHLPGDFFTVTLPQPAQAREIRSERVRRRGVMFDEDHHVYERPDAPIGRAVVFHDSFARMLMPFLSELFGHVEYRWSRELDYRLVEEQCPDVVIFELVERGLTEWHPLHLPAAEELADLPPGHECQRKTP